VAEEEVVKRRTMNLERARLFGRDKERVIVFICECGDSGCRETVLLTAPQFAAIAAADELVVHPHHPITAARHRVACSRMVTSE